MPRYRTFVTTAALAVALSGCADFFAYNFARRPHIIVIPEKRLASRISEARRN